MDEHVIFSGKGGKAPTPCVDDSGQDMLVNAELKAQVHGLSNPNHRDA
jgi:hypothetical protein